MDNEKVKDSILLTVKKMLGGINEDNEHFDIDLLVIINSIFTVLAQVGVGPEVPFKVEDADTEWSEFDCNDLEAVKEYIYLKTKATFDPPQNGSVMGSYDQRASELEWRLHVFSEEIRDAE